MKVLHINTYDYGGAAIAAIRLHKALLAQSINSSMLFLSKTDNYLPNSYGFADKSVINAGFVRRQYNRFKKKYLLKYTNNYINNQKLRNKPEGFEKFSFNPGGYDITTQTIYQESDIIHLHWIAGFVDYRFFQKNKKPVLWTLHDMNPFTGGCHYSSGCEKFITECKNCPQLHGTINSDNSFLDQEYKKSFLDGQAHVVTAPSQWLMNCSSKSRLFGTFKNIHVLNSFDIDIFKPHDKLFSRIVFNLPPRDKILLFVSESRENRRKGFDILLDAIKKLNNPSIHLCAIGSGIIECDNESRITFLGKISDERLMALAYSAADAFILPSREDNLPNTMLESLACGTPVIAFSVGGMRDAIKTGFNGILKNDISSDSLANALNEFLEGKYIFDCNEISENARRNFSPLIQVEKFLTLYHGMLV